MKTLLIISVLCSAVAYTQSGPIQTPSEKICFDLANEINTKMRSAKAWCQAPK